MKDKVGGSICQAYRVLEPDERQLHLLLEEQAAPGRRREEAGWPQRGGIIAGNEEREVEAGGGRGTGRAEAG